MSYYSLVCIEVVKDVYERCIKFLKKNKDIRRPVRVFERENSYLGVWEWNHVCASDIEDTLEEELGLDWRDYNMYVVGEGNDEKMNEVYEAGGLVREYTGVREDGSWSVDDDCSVVCDYVREVEVSYRLSDDELKEKEEVNMREIYNVLCELLNEVRYMMKEKN